MSPALLLTLLLILLSAFAFHAGFGRTMRGLAAFVVAALAGFVLGEATARALVHDWGQVGPIHMVHGLVGAWLAMVVTRQRVA